MKLSVSVRIAEGFGSKEIPLFPLAEVANIATAASYSAICMRASQIGTHTESSQVEAAKELLDSHGLSVSMITGDFDTVYNNDRGPNALRNIEPYLQLATQLNAPMIRVALKNETDIAAAQTAADLAAKVGLKLVHQCHIQSLFETVDGILETLKKIARPNFGLIYEPANLELCGQDYVAAIEPLAPWLFNVYLQNQKLKPEGAVKLETWSNGQQNFDIIPIHEVGGIEFASVLETLQRVGYSGTVTVHQSAGEGEDPLTSTRDTANFLRPLICAD